MKISTDTNKKFCNLSPITTILTFTSMMKIQVQFKIRCQIEFEFVGFMQNKLVPGLFDFSKSCCYIPVEWHN